MNCLNERKANTSRVKQHLQKADIRNLHEMKRFGNKQKILGKDYRRSMFLINKNIQEVQKTLVDIKLISGYCHQSYTAHLRSVSSAFPPFKDCKRVKKLGNIDLKLERGDLEKSELVFGRRHDSMKQCLFDEDIGNCKSNLSKVDQRTLTPETNACKKMRVKNIKNGLCNNMKDDYFKASSSHVDDLELFSSEFNRNDKMDGHPQKTFQVSCNKKTDLKNSSLFPIQIRAAPVHKKLDLHKRPMLKSIKPSRELDVQSSKTLSRYIQDNNAIARSQISKAFIKRGLDLLIKEYNYSQNPDSGKQSVLHNKVSDFISELSEIKCDYTE